MNRLKCALRELWISSVGGRSRTCYLQLMRLSWNRSTSPANEADLSLLVEMKGIEPLSCLPDLTL